MKPLSDEIQTMMERIMRSRPFNPYTYSVDDQTILFVCRDLLGRFG